MDNWRNKETLWGCYLIINGLFYVSVLFSVISICNWFLIHALQTHLIVGHGWYDAISFLLIIPLYFVRDKLKDKLKKI
jgi:hypothetical protein